ncbi:MAG: division/cell wall cluster transcriptional repressor MraZ [Bacteroidota bacterium]
MEIQEILGEFEVTLDGKGRFRIPSGLLKNLGDREDVEFVVNRGFEKCLTLYPKALWQEIRSEVDKLNLYNKQNRAFARYFYRGATEVKPDSADRVLLPKRLQEYAGMQKEIILSAMSGRIEIWAKAEYDRMLEEEPSDFSDLAEHVLGGNPSLQEPSSE